MGRGLDITIGLPEPETKCLKLQKEGGIEITCAEDGNFETKQCISMFQLCYCVDRFEGNAIDGTEGPIANFLQDCDNPTRRLI